MKKNLLSLGCWLGIIFLLTGCSFPLDESDPVHIQEPEPGILDATLLTVEQDTIFLSYSSTFKLGLDYTGAGTFYDLSVSVDDIVVINSSPNTYFDLHPEDYGPGYYRLKLTVSYLLPKQTLSSTAVLPLESFDYYWVLAVDAEPPAMVQLTHVIQYGFLKLVWDKPAKSNFQHFILRKNNRQIILNKESVEYLDLSYVGGSVTYSLTMYSPTFQQTSEWYVSDVPTDSTWTSWRENNILEISWKPVRYYGSTVNIGIDDEIYPVRPDNLNNPIRIQKHLQFGELTNVKISFQSDPGLSLFDKNYEMFQGVRLGDPFNSGFTEFIYSPVNQAAYGQYSGGVLKLDKEGNLLDIWQPNDGNYIENLGLALAPNEATLCLIRNNMLYVFQSASLNLISQTNLTQLTGNNNSEVIKRLAYLTDDLIQFSINEQTYVFSRNTRSIVFQAEGEGLFSPDTGHFLNIKNNSIDRIITGSPVVWRQETEALEGFFIDNTTLVYLTGDPSAYTMKTLDLPSNTVRPGISLSGYNNPVIHSVDPVRGRFLLHSDTRWAVISYEKNELELEEVRFEDALQYLMEEEVVTHYGFKIGIEELKRIRGL